MVHDKHEPDLACNSTNNKRYSISTNSGAPTRGNFNQDNTHICTNIAGIELSGLNNKR